MEGKADATCVDSKDKIAVERKPKKRKNLPTPDSVVYIKNIPHGFYEDEMKGYFSQFGRVLKVRVSRSAKTGNSRGYGYILFQDREVAQVAAETMNNYLMYDKIMKCKLLLKEEFKREMLTSASRRPGVRCPGLDRRLKHIEQLSSKRTCLQTKRAKRRRAKSLKKTVAKFSDAGIEVSL